VTAEGPPSPVEWVSAFVDVPPDLLETSLSFWTSVSASTVGSAVGEQGEFLPLEPSDGDPCLWLQRIDEGPVGCHPDLYVADVASAADRAVALGATRVSTTDGLVVLRSPGAMPFCLVTHRAQSQRPGPVGPAGARSIVDQICLDIPSDRFDDECDFWAALTGWARSAVDSSEFNRLAHPSDIPYAFLLQRLDDDQPSVTAHLDLAGDDREAVIARQQAWGADVVRRTPGWTVMRDPVGMVYCITGRRPGQV
jgi:Glyoxalase-like domain